MHSDWTGARPVICLVIVFVIIYYSTRPAQRIEGPVACRERPTDRKTDGNINTELLKLCSMAPFRSVSYLLRSRRMTRNTILNVHCAKIKCQRVYTVKYVPGVISSPFLAALSAVDSTYVDHKQGHCTCALSHY